MDIIESLKQEAHTYNIKLVINSYRSSDMNLALNYGSHRPHNWPIGVEFLPVEAFLHEDFGKWFIIIHKMHYCPDYVVAGAIAHELGHHILFSNPQGKHGKWQWLYNDKNLYLEERAAWKQGYKILNRILKSEPNGKAFISGVRLLKKTALATYRYHLLS